MSEQLNENQKQVLEAYIWIRKNNTSVPDHILNTMRDAAFRAFTTVPSTADRLMRIDWDRVPFPKREKILSIIDMSDKDFIETYLD